MPLIENDDEVNPKIAPAQLAYIQCLSDTQEQYTRFFDALLVPRPSHAAFFRDLRAFRVLPTTIKAFTLCNPDDLSTTKEQRKENYRDVTRKFLGSRFAHPWCRKAMDGTGSSTGGGWWGAEWSATGRKMGKQHQEQEEKLHKTLLPIWVCFRGKMFPDTVLLEEWWEKHQLEPQPVPAASIMSSSRNSPEMQVTQAGLSSPPELRMAQGRSNLQYDSDVEDDDEAEEETSRQATTVATGLLRLAAASMMVSSMPKMQQWKLKRELKKRAR